MAFPFTILIKAITIATNVVGKTIIITTFALEADTTAAAESGTIRIAEGILLAADTTAAVVLASNRIGAKTIAILVDIITF